MIKDLSVMADIRTQWSTVDRMCSSVHRTYVTMDGIMNESPPDEFYNLPLILAFAVVDQILDELKAQGSLSWGGGRVLLGAKIKAAETAIPWLDFANVGVLKDRRNDIAHEAKLLSKEECLAGIDLLRKELQHWKIIPVS